MTQIPALRAMAAAASLSLLAGLSACNGGGGDETTLAPVLTQACASRSGNLDALQTALTGTLAPAAAQIPQLGTPAASLTTVLAQNLDAIDAIAGALNTLASTQNPQAFTAQLDAVGDSLTCSSSNLNAALAQLSVSSGVPIPGLAQAQSAISNAQGAIAGGLSGGAPGADLQLITARLVGVAATLQTLTANLPTGANQPYVTALLNLNAASYNALAKILTDFGKLDGQSLAADVTSLLQSFAILPASLAGQFGVPASALQPVNTQAATALSLTGSGLGTVAAPILNAVSLVLGVAVGASNVNLAFADLLAGGLSGLNQPRTTQLANLLPGGALGSNGLPTPTLLNTLLTNLGGVLPIGL